jgi:hypothetical protein
MRFVSSLLAGLAFAALSAAAAPPEATAPAAAKPPDKVVTIDPNAKPPVCRRYVPTGSRIATERCESAPLDSSAAAQEAHRETIRRDMAELRALQAMRDQARTQAIAEALRRRAAGL